MRIEEVATNATEHFIVFGYDDTELGVIHYDENYGHWGFSPNQYTESITAAELRFIADELEARG